METSGTESHKEQIKTSPFIISKPVYEEMIEYCRHHLPFEACGLLSGEEGFGKTLWEIRNEAESRNRFFMSKTQIELAVNEMENQGEQVTAIFHSHPSTAANPSTHDIQHNPYHELAYLIVSFQHDDQVNVRCFQTNGNTATPIDLIIDNG